MPPILAKFLVSALMTSVVVLPCRLAGVQPNNRFSWGPTVAPFGPHALSGTTPTLLTASNAPCTAVGWSGSVTSSPPPQAGVPPRTQPGGLLAMVGIEV